MDLKLKGRRAILAGATKGIGRAAAEALADEGCNIALCARDAARLEGTLAALRAKGVNAIGSSVDLTDPERYKGWVASAAQSLGGCDIFISFASAGGGPPSEERWKANFELDLLGTWRGIEAALPFLEKSDAASIIAVATNVATEPAFGPQAYAPMKAALVNYASALAQAYAPKGIRVNTISPGPIYFEDGDWGKIKAGRPEVYQRTLAKVAAGRLGEGAEVGRAIAFLASPACPFITGANLFIDGGMTKRAQF
ncbi:MAG TPA: SDR family oxidoreductase [Burkholderiales bacterium]|nr:SDR family oxidoreductase [Burkholderiales bacterium]